MISAIRHPCSHPAQRPPQRHLCFLPLLTTRSRLIRAVPAVIVQVTSPGDGDAAPTGTGELVGRAGPSWCRARWTEL